MKTSSQKFEKSSEKLRQEIEKFAKENLGFDIVAFTPAKIHQKYKDAFSDWLKNNREGEMSYMQKIQERFDLEKVLPGAKSVIVLATNYYREQAPLKRGHGRVARYAYGRDYHKVIGKRLKLLEKFIGELRVSFPSSFPPEPNSPSENCTAFVRTKSSGETSPPSSPGQLTKSYVDTGPLMERALAEQAGIGRIGKNGCVISKELGSWILLSEIITTLDLSPGISSGRPEKPDRWSNPAEKSFNVCGNCTRCIDACPTGAIIAPGVVDSRLCISYLTIEHKGKLDPKLEKIIKKTKRVFGCDICQEVCPHNHARQRICSQKHNDKPPSDPFHPPIAGDQLNLSKIRKITSREDYIKSFAGSPLMRAKYIKNFS